MLEYLLPAILNKLLSMCVQCLPEIHDHKEQGF